MDKETTTYRGGDGEDQLIYSSAINDTLDINLRTKLAKVEIGSDTIDGIENITAGQKERYNNWRRERQYYRWTLKGTDSVYFKEILLNTTFK